MKKGCSTDWSMIYYCRPFGTYPALSCTMPRRTGENKVLSPDTLLADRYRIIRVLGEGGFGTIYLGHDETLDRDVAVKELLREPAVLSPETWQHYQSRFRKEAQVMSQISHPHIVSAYALHADAAGNLYLVLEYVDGGSLKEIIERSGVLPIERALDIAIDICQAIEAIYQRDVVHRDIKPSNILISSDGTAKLTDFGVAQVGHETRRTQEASSHPGTPAYKSPEQSSTNGYLDQRSDLYALGLVLYEMLTGQLYVRNRVPPRHQRPEVPQALNAIVMKALEDDPDNRYQSAGELLRDLERVRQQSTWGQAQVVLQSIPRRHLVVAAAIAAVLFLGNGMARLGRALNSLQHASSPTPSESLATSSAQPTPLALAPSEGVRQPLAGVEAALATPTSWPSAPGLQQVQVPNTPSAPVPIVPGETLSRVFAHEGQSEQFTFRSRAGRQYVITTSNLGAGVDTRLEVLAGDWYYVNDDISPGTLASQVVFDALEDSTVIVTVHNQGQFGPERGYDLSVMVSAVVPADAPPTSDAELPEDDAPDRPTMTPRPTFTRGPTSTFQPTSTPRATSTPRPTSTTRPTWTRVPTATRTPTRTSTPSITPTPSITSTPSATQTTAPPTSAPPTLTHTPVPPTEEPTKTPIPERTPLPTSEPGPPGE